MGTIRIIPDSVPFSISPDGNILVKSSADLDRETTASFSFQVNNKAHFIIKYDNEFCAMKM